MCGYDELTKQSHEQHLRCFDIRVVRCFRAALQLAVRNPVDLFVPFPRALLKNRQGRLCHFLPRSVLARACPARLQNEPVQAKSAGIDRHLRGYARAAVRQQTQFKVYPERVDQRLGGKHRLPEQ